MMLSRRRPFRLRSQRARSYREERYDEKISQILLAAARVFRRKSYRGATMEEIAAALRMTKGSLYYYFRNKEEIIYTCHVRCLEIGFRALDLARKADKPADERLRILLTHYIRGLTDELRASVVLLEEGVLSTPLVAKLIEMRDQYERGLRQIIREGIEQGTFVQCDPKVEAFIILGSVNWISKWYSPDGEFSSDALADAFANRLIRGLLRSRD